MSQKQTIAVLVLFLTLNICLSEKMVLEKKVKLFEQDSHPYDPPFFIEKAKRARYLLHYVEWATIATISTHYNMGLSPFSNVVAITDGTANNSTGIPYMYLSKFDESAQDAKRNNNVSLTVSEIETAYCKNHGYIAQTPLCARLTFFGKFEEVTSSDEREFALNALFTRFPQMKDWPKDHGFFPAKLSIRLIWLLDFYGGASIVSVDDYMNANPLH